MCVDLPRGASTRGWRVDGGEALPGHGGAGIDSLGECRRLNFHHHLDRETDRSPLTVLRECISELLLHRLFDVALVGTHARAAMWSAY